MFNLVEVKAYNLEMNDREYGVVGLALCVSGSLYDEDWTKQSLIGTIGEALIKYASYDEGGEMDVYNKMGEDMLMYLPEFLDILCKFNNFVQTMPEGSKVHIFDF